MTTTLVALKGSEKQISWAEQIRPKMWAQVVACVDGMLEIVEHADDPEKASTMRREILLIKRGIEIQPSASWWIDRRDDLAGLLVGGAKAAQLTGWDTLEAASWIQEVDARRVLRARGLL